MRKIIKHLAVISAIFLALGGFISCSNGSDDPEPMTFTVTISKTENGTVTADKTSGVTEGTEVTLTVTPSDGYELDTLTVKNGETAVTVTDNKFKMPAADVTVNATFKLKQFTVTFNTDGGSSVGSKTVDYDTTVTAPTDPTKEGYKFDGWYNGDTKFEFTTTIKDNLTLTAKWIQLVTTATALESSVSKEGEVFIALGADITLDKTLTISKSLTLDLNGRTITRGEYTSGDVRQKHIEIDNADVVFTLKDSSIGSDGKPTGKILSPESSSGYTVWVKQGTFNFESGTIEQRTYSYNSGNGGSYGVCIGANNGNNDKVGTFNLKGGKIQYTAKRMGAVKVEDYINGEKHSVFNMESGEIYAVSTEVPTNPDVVMNYGAGATGASEYYKVAVANFGETYIKGGKITGDLYCDPQSGLDNKDPIIKVTGGEIIGGILGTSSHTSGNNDAINSTIEISGGTLTIYGIQTKKHGTENNCATIEFTGGTYDLSKCLVDVDDSKVEVGDAVSSYFSGIDGYILEDGKLHIFTMGYIKGTGNSTDYKLADSDYPEGSEANVNRTSDWINDTFWFKFSNTSNISGKYVWMKFVGSDNKAAAIDCGKDFVKAGNYYAGSFLNKGQWDYMADSMKKSNTNSNDNKGGNYDGEYTVYVYAFDSAQTKPDATSFASFGKDGTLIGSSTINVVPATYSN